MMFQDAFQFVPSDRPVSPFALPGFQAGVPPSFTGPSPFHGLDVSFSSWVSPNHSSSNRSSQAATTAFARVCDAAEACASIETGPRTSGPIPVPEASTRTQRPHLGLYGREHASRGSSCALALLRASNSLDTCSEMGSLLAEATAGMDCSQHGGGTSSSDGRTSFEAGACNQLGSQDCPSPLAVAAEVACAAGGGRATAAGSLLLVGRPQLYQTYSAPLLRGSGTAGLPHSGSSAALADKLRELNAQLAGQGQGTAPLNGAPVPEGGAGPSARRTSKPEDITRPEAWEGRVHNGMPRANSVPLMFHHGSMDTGPSIGTSVVVPSAGGAAYSCSVPYIVSARSAGSPPGLAALIEEEEEAGPAEP